MREQSRKTGWAACALVLAFAFAGCAGSAPSKAAGVSPGGGEIRQSVGATAAQAGLGTIAGSVLNENGAPLKGAKVSLLGASQHGTSDERGKFTFTEVEPGRHVLRADLEGYETLENPVDVQKDAITQVDVILVAEGGRSTGFREHVHNLWKDGETERTIIAKTFNLDVDETCLDWAVLATGSKGGGCADFPLKPESLVPPGTKELHVTVTWAKQDFLKTVDFQFAPANTSQHRTLAGLASGETRVVPVVPPMNDHGHAQFTLWDYVLIAKPQVSNGVPLSESNVNRQQIGDVTVRVVAERADFIPPEPPHARYWANGSSIDLRFAWGDHKVAGSATALSPARDPGATGCRSWEPCFNLTKSGLVPPGTTRLLATLEWGWGQAAVSAVAKQKALAFRPGNIDPKKATANDLVVPVGKVEGTKATYEIKVNPEWTDSFYQRKSTFFFYVSNAGDEKSTSYQPDCPLSCGGDTFKLTVTAVDDDWTPDLAGGR